MDTDSTNQPNRESTTAPVMVPDRKVQRGYNLLASVHDRVNELARRANVSANEMAERLLVIGFNHQNEL